MREIAATIQSKDAAQSGIVHIPAQAKVPTQGACGIAQGTQRMANIQLAIA